jgi:hypothetical protein
MSSEYRPPTVPAPQAKKSPLPWILGGCALLLLIGIVVAAGGYGYYRWREARKSNARSAEIPDRGAEDNRQPDARTSPAAANGNSNQPVAQSAGPGKPTSWETTASSLTGPDGTTFTLSCTPGGTMHSVWGSDIYTADSSICTAAVHAGLISYERGGTVTIELRPGRPIYGNSERNGVATNSYGEYGRSFVFKTGSGDRQVKEDEEGTPILWTTSASILKFEPGKTWKFKCPAAGTPATIWGSDVYTGDSSICTAGVHGGIITLERGGAVTVELRPGQSSYQGTTRNGVKSTDYATYGSSFVVK